MKKIKRSLSFGLILLLVITVLTGCGGSSEKVTAAAPMAANTDAKSYKTEMVAETTAAASYKPAADAIKSENTTSTSSALGGSTTVDPIADTSRKLIRTVHIDVETYDFDTLLTKLQEQIKSLSGYIEQSDISGNSVQSNNSRRRAYMTIRIPSTDLDSFISSVEAEGNVTNKSETTSDVTLQYSDLESRKKSLTIEQDRIWELLEKADTLESIIALEERLSEIRYELESMESRLRRYDNQVEYSTVYVNVEEVKIYTPTAPLTFGERIANGFSENVENMKEFATDLIILIITTIPIWLPALLIGMALLFLIKRKAAGKRIQKNMMKFPNEVSSDFEDHTP